MRNPFNFEAEPFELYLEFDEYEAEQPDTYSEFDEEYESDFEGEPFETYSEFDETELYEEYSDPESFEGVFKRRPQPICKAGLDDLTELKDRIDFLNVNWENGHLDLIEDSSKRVIEQGNLIKKRLKNGWYKRKGCTTKDLESIQKLKTNR